MGRILDAYPERFNPQAEAQAAAESEARFREDEARFEGTDAYKELRGFIANKIREARWQPGMDQAVAASMLVAQTIAGEIEDWLKVRAARAREKHNG